MTALYETARAFLHSPLMHYQPPTVARTAVELCHALRGDETREVTVRLVNLLADLDMTRAEGLRAERDELARECLARLERKAEKPNPTLSWTVSLPTVREWLGKVVPAYDWLGSMGDVGERHRKAMQDAIENVGTPATYRAWGCEDCGKTQVKPDGSGVAFQHAPDCSGHRDKFGSFARYAILITAGTEEQASSNAREWSESWQRRQSRPQVSDAPAVEPGEGWRLLQEGRRLRTGTNTAATNGTPK